MRLPGINYTGRGVQSLGREDIRLPAMKEGRRADALHSTYRGIAEVAEDQAEKFLARQRRLEEQDRTEKMAQRRRELATEFEEKTYYDLDELPADLEVTRTQKSFDEDWNEIEVERTRIPGYEVKAAIFDYQMRALAKQLAYGFTNQDQASQWLHQQTMMIERAHQTISVEMVAEQQRTIQLKHVEDMQAQIEERRYDLARYTIDSMEVSDEVKAPMYRKLENIIETDQYDMILADLEQPFARNELEAGLAFVTAEDEDYYGSNGTLSPDARRTYANAFRSAINKLDNRDSAVNDRARNILRVQMVEAMKQLASGQMQDPRDINSMIAEAMTMKGLEDEAYKLQLQMGAYELFSEMASGPSGMSITAMEEARQIAARNGDRPQAMMYRMAIDLAKAQAESRKTDSVTYAERWEAMPRSSLTRANMADVAPNRIKAYNAGQIQHLMKPAEKAAIVHSLTKMPLQERMVMARQRVEAFGPQSHTALEELGQAGMSAPVLMAGQMMASGDVVTAEYVMNGLGLAEADTNGRFLKDQKDDVNIFIDEKLLGVGVSDSRRQEAYRSGIELTYRALAHMYGKQPGVYDEKLLAAATEMVLTDRVHEWKGQTVELPPGWKAAEWDDYWNDIPHDLFAEKYQPTNYNGTSIPKDLESGKLAPVYVGDGSYYLFNMTDNPPRAIFRKAQGDETGPQVLEFTPDRADVYRMPVIPLPPIAQPQRRQVEREDRSGRSRRSNREIMMKRNPNGTPEF